MTIPPAKILIVEDDRQLLALMRINLELAGHTVLIVSNGPQGVALAAQEQPDLILLDIRLPGMNGLDVCRQIRRFSSVPIIMHYLCTLLIPMLTFYNYRALRNRR